MSGYCVISDITLNPPKLVPTIKRLSASIIPVVCTAAATNAGTFSVTGSKSGRHDDLTVAVAYTLVYQQIEVGDQIISAMVLADAWAAPSDDADNITVASGEITSTTNLSAASLFLVWRDVTAG